MQRLTALEILNETCAAYTLDTRAREGYTCRYETSDGKWTPGPWTQEREFNERGTVDIATVTMCGSFGAIPRGICNWSRAINRGIDDGNGKAD